MSTEKTLTAQKRSRLGSAECRRLRREGIVPGNVYGHTQDPVAIGIDEVVLTTLVNSGTKVLRLEVEGRSETTVLRDVQWNTWGTQIEHFDLLRVDPDEKVTIDVAIELRGTAPGVVAGGVLDHHLHTLTVDCPAIDIPDRITVRIHTLEIGQTIHLSDLELPASVHPHHPPETIIVRVTEPAAEVGLEVPEGATGAEPEVVGRKSEADKEG